MALARHCIVKKNLHYYRSRYNGGVCEFRAGDHIFVVPEEFPRLKLKGFVSPVEEEFREVIAAEEVYFDWFPRTSKEVWVFGDGPTATLCKDKPSTNAVVFAVNRCMLEPLSLTPDYYTALDNEFFREDWNLAPHLPAAPCVGSLSSLRKFTKRGNHSADKLLWHDLRRYDVLGETGFSDTLGEVYHGKTSTYIALQLAIQSQRGDYKGLVVHLAGIDFANLRHNGKVISHHYGHGNYQEPLYFRMLESFRYGLNWLNEMKVYWINHSPLLASRIIDLEGEYGYSEF